MGDEDRGSKERGSKERRGERNIEDDKLGAEE